MPQSNVHGTFQRHVPGRYGAPSPSSSSVKCGLNISHVNINSITAPNKLDELEQFATINSIHVLCATETKLDSTVSSTLYTMKAFSPPFTKHRTRRGGGVAIFARTNISCTRLQELEWDDLEGVWVKIRTKKETVLICCVYLPPNQRSTDFRLFLDKLSDSALEAQKHHPSIIVIMGDFNLGNIYLNPDFKNHSGVTHFDFIFQDTINSLSLTQIITEPTRVTDKIANLRDLIIVSDRQCVADYGLLSPFANIDHIPIYARLNFEIPDKGRCVKSVYDYSRLDIDRFIQIFENKNWDETMNMDVDAAVESLTQFILDAASQSMPKINISSKCNDKPWVGKKLIHELIKRNKLFRVAKVTNNAADWNLWKTQRNLVSALNRRFKNKYIARQVKKLIDSKQNPQQYHQILKQMIGRERTLTLPPMLDERNEICENSLDKANLLNDFFANQSRTTVSEHVVPHCLVNREVPSLSDITVNEDEVFDVLKTLKVNKACGPDGISNKLLKMAAIFLKEPLTKLFNKSLREGRYPTSWKHANIIPIFKNKGSRSDVKCYRPISLLASMSKIFEKLVYNRLYEHLTCNSLITDRQSGYRHHHGTYTQLIYLIHKMYSSLDKQCDFTIIYLDITRYFDTIWHEGLLAKCRLHCGLNGNLLSWLTSYLHNRTHSVRVDNCTSRTQTINAGCPQGSVLGPLLALIYLNDLDGETENELLFFADDTILFKSHLHGLSEAERSLQRDIAKIEHFGDKWAITFNSSKTTQQTFTNKRILSPPTLTFGRSLIPSVANHKHLGLNITTDLKFHFHTQEVVRRANAALAPLYPVAKFIPRSVLKQIYLTYVRPLLDYGDAVFHDSLTLRDSLNLERVQNRAARLITGAFRRTPIHSLLVELGLTTLHTRREISTLKLFHKIKYHAPSYILDVIPGTRHEQTQRDLRNSQSISIPLIRLSSVKNTFFPSTIKRWNRLSEDTKSIRSAIEFKRTLEKMYGEKKPSLYYSMGTKRENILHTRLRLGMTSLNSHLFQIHSPSVDSPYCNCDSLIESVKHYFLSCPQYAQEREELEASLRHLINDYHTLNFNDKLTVILHGPGKNSSLCLAVAASVQKYIRATKRFELYV